MFVAGKLFQKAGEGSGGDSHNKGWYATLSDLTTAHPTAEAGDWAIVGATDTVWVWDTDESEWVDTDQKGQVTSVNNQTGDVTIGANDILPSQTGYSGRVLGTDGFVAGWVEPEIVQRSTMPQASADELGNIYQFVGTTDANYTNGYFYKCVGTTTGYTGDVAIAASFGDLMVDCDGDDFINFLMTEGGVTDPTVVIRGGMVYTAGTTTWTLTAYDNDGNTVCTISATQSDYESAGFTFVGTPADGNICSFVSTITSTTTYSWSAVQVQAGGGGGSYTAGTGIDITSSVISVAEPTVQNTADYTNEYSFAVGGASVTSGSIASVGIGFMSSVNGGNAVAIGQQTNAAYQSTAVGANAVASAQHSTAVGESATVVYDSLSGYNGQNGVAIGSQNIVFQEGGIAIGHRVNSAATGAIQLGYIDDNSTPVNNNDANTFKVANANGNFEIMSADGTVPTDRFTTTPSADGTYVPTLTISSGVATRTWGSGGGGGGLPSQTGNAGKFLTTDGTDASWGDALANTETATDGYAFAGAVAQGKSYTLAAGGTAYCNATDGVALGYNARAANAGCVSIGRNSGATGTYAIAIGYGSATSKTGDVAIGNGAEVDTFGSGTGNTIQLGAGTNQDQGSFQVKSYQLLTKAGIIPADRLASTTGLADGNYRLRLVMASGVPTLEWVAE